MRESVCIFFVTVNMSSGILFPYNTADCNGLPLNSTLQTIWPFYFHQYIALVLLATLLRQLPLFYVILYFLWPCEEKIVRWDHLSITSCLGCSLLFLTMQGKSCLLKLSLHPVFNWTSLFFKSFAVLSVTSMVQILSKSLQHALPIHYLFCWCSHWCLAF